MPAKTSTSLYLSTALRFRPQGDAFRSNLCSALRFHPKGIAFRSWAILQANAASRHPPLVFAVNGGPSTRGGGRSMPPPQVPAVNGDSIARPGPISFEEDKAYLRTAPRIGPQGLAFRSDLCPALHICPQASCFALISAFALKGIAFRRANPCAHYGGTEHTRLRFFSCR